MDCLYHLAHRVQFRIRCGSPYTIYSGGSRTCVFLKGQTTVRISNEITLSIPPCADRTPIFFYSLLFVTSNEWNLILPIDSMIPLRIMSRFIMSLYSIVLCFVTQLEDLCFSLHSCVVYNWQPAGSCYFLPNIFLGPLTTICGYISDSSVFLVRFGSGL